MEKLMLALLINVLYVLRRVHHQRCKKWWLNVTSLSLIFCWYSIPIFGSAMFKTEAMRPFTPQSLLWVCQVNWFNFFKYTLPFYPHDSVTELKKNQLSLFSRTEHSQLSGANNFRYFFLWRKKNVLVSILNECPLIQRVYPLALDHSLRIKYPPITNL